MMKSVMKDSYLINCIRQGLAAVRDENLTDQERRYRLSTFIGELYHIQERAEKREQI